MFIKSKYVGLFFLINLGLPIACKNDDPDSTPRQIEIEELQEDLDYYAEQMPINHVNLFHGITETQFQDMITTVESKITDLTDVDFALELTKITAFISSEGRDGHTGIIPFQEALSFNMFPFVVFQFKDGVFIVNAKEEQLIGQEILEIGGLPIAEVFEEIKPYVSQDNEHSLKRNLALGVTLAEPLNALGILTDITEMSLLVENQQGQQSTTVVGSVNPSEYFTLFPETRFLGFPEQNEPLNLTNLSDVFWKSYLPDTKSIYFQYSAIYSQNNSGITLSEMSLEIEEMISSLGVERLIIDLRQNEGGDNTTFAPLLDMIIRNRLNTEEKIFVLIGRGTFSAGMNFATAMETKTNAIFVGEPTGGAPNHYGDGMPFILPNTNLAVHVSTRYHQDSFAGDQRLTLYPDILLELESIDYFLGVDPVLNIILKL